MKRFYLPKLVAIIAVFSFVLAGCTVPGNSPASSGSSTPETSSSAEPATVEITDVHGTVTVPVNSKNVVSLDNRTFETLSEWGIELAAVPKGVMSPESPYYLDSDIQDIGDHREPNLEVIAAVNPDLVIVGQRFVDFYDDIKALVPNAVVIDLNFELSAEAGKSGDSLINGLKDSTTTLGKIFDKNQEATQLNASFDKAIQDAKAAYNGTDKIMSVVVSGGEIGFSAPYSGRVWGPMFDALGWVSALEIDGASSDHKGDDISVEAIAQSNPDWIMVLDREASFAPGDRDGYTPANDVINNSPALKNTTAITKNQIVYAPDDTYTTESVQTYREMFEAITKAFSK